MLTLRCAMLGGIKEGGDGMNIAWGHTHLPAQLGIQSGVTDVFRVEASEYVDHRVEFDAPFPVVPVVVVGMYSTSTAPQIGSVAVALMAADEDGFTVRVFNDGASARLPQVGWIAVGVAQPQRPEGRGFMILDSGRLDEATLG